MMVEYSAPVYFEGKFSGQVAFDRDLASLSSTLSAMKTLKGEDIFLISAQGRNWLRHSVYISAAHTDTR